MCRVRLRVDDREIASGTLGEQNIIGSASSQLFIGGFPDGIKPPANEMPIAESMIGCVSNIFVDYQSVYLLFLHKTSKKKTIKWQVLSMIEHCHAQHEFFSPIRWYTAFD